MLGSTLQVCKGSETCGRREQLRGMRWGQIKGAAKAALQVGGRGRSRVVAGGSCVAHWQ